MFKSLLIALQPQPVVMQSFTFFLFPVCGMIWLVCGQQRFFKTLVTHESVYGNYPNVMCFPSLLKATFLVLLTSLGQMLPTEEENQLLLVHSKQKKKKFFKHHFLCFSLSQIGGLCQYLKGSTITWKDHNWNIGVFQDLKIPMVVP